MARQPRLNIALSDRTVQTASNGASGLTDAPGPADGVRVEDDKAGAAAGESTGGTLTTRGGVPHNIEGARAQLDPREPVRSVSPLRLVSG